MKRKYTCTILNEVFDVEAVHSSDASIIAAEKYRNKFQLDGHRIKGVEVLVEEHRGNVSKFKISTTVTYKAMELGI